MEGDKRRGDKGEGDAGEDVVVKVEVIATSSNSLNFRFNSSC